MNTDMTAKTPTENLVSMECADRVPADTVFGNS